NKADFVACHNPSYVIKGFKMVNDVKPGGVFLINCQWTAEELNEHMPAEAKRYIAKNNVQLYTVNAIDLAMQIGMGKRTNTILQAAFFALAKVMPIEEAVGYMKDAATRSYLKKGQDVVDMNHKAIDAGVSAFVKIDVPADWATAEDKVEEVKLEGNEKLVKMVKNIMMPVAKMDGDSLPVSTFVDHFDGGFEQGASAYEKRGVAVMVPEWLPENCIQCNQCSFVCPHATIRPYALNADEAAAAPEAAKLVDMKGKGFENYKFTMAVSPLDCMGCGVCVDVCPSKTKALVMKPREEQEIQQPVFNYMVAKVTKKDDMPAETTVKGSQFNQALLEFSGSCAGCAETAYARLVTQLFGERMYVSNATGCSSIWGGPAATSPYTTNVESGFGPAWCNSLFEDNAEHGLGMYFGQKAVRDRLIAKLEAAEVENADVKAAIEEFLATKEEGKANAAATKKLVAALEACGCDFAKEILAQKEFLSKKSTWILGGDGWAYDIGFGGLDHVLASGEDVNVLVFDTEVYSNTGGQASKASNIGQVAQFAAAGKNVAKKSLAEIAMAYGYVYVAQVAMGADKNQTLKALVEAENYHGPSIVICYSPCEMHSIKGGMTNCQSEMKKAVDCGYWNLFRFNPALKAEGKNPFTLDSKAPAGGYREFLMNEARYASLTRSFPERAEELFAKSEETAKARYEHLTKLIDLYA
ncbi:MAG: 2-oxoacid:acceptor oxidoreductase family protein, partial [Oscillospiraceae bacterium]|nr:2-oxoacid:acceptor oxidoreductase family protein [Oscillospiraceae bacterium]